MNNLNNLKQTYLYKLNKDELIYLLLIINNERCKEQKAILEQAFENSLPKMNHGDWLDLCANPKCLILINPGGFNYGTTCDNCYKCYCDGCLNDFITSCEICCKHYCPDCCDECLYKKEDKKEDNDECLCKKEI